MVFYAQSTSTGGVEECGLVVQQRKTRLFGASTHAHCEMTGSTVSFNVEPRVRLLKYTQRLQASTTATAVTTSTPCLVVARKFVTFEDICNGKK